MKVFSCVLIMLLVFFNSLTAQKREPAILPAKSDTARTKKQEKSKELVDTGKLFLIINRDSKPLLSLNADFSRSSGWLNFTVNDTAGNRKFQSLLQVVNENLIQWELFDGTTKKQPSESKGEIIIKRKQ